MTELENLEQKLAQLVALTHEVRNENRDLRLRMTRMEAENKSLQDKVDTARAKLESLIERLPDLSEEA
jgi:peptidoglycan hydrolase CwlO-like protein